MYACVCVCCVSVCGVYVCGCVCVCVCVGCVCGVYVCACVCVFWATKRVRHTSCKTAEELTLSEGYAEEEACVR